MHIPYKNLFHFDHMEMWCIFFKAFVTLNKAGKLEWTRWFGLIFRFMFRWEDFVTFYSAMKSAGTTKNTPGGFKSCHLHQQEIATVC